MSRFLFILLAGCVHFFSFAQIRPNEITYNITDTITLFKAQEHPAYIYSLQINHREASIGNKILRGTLYVSSYNITMGTYLLVAPEYVSKWNKKEKFQIKSIVNQYRKSFTTAPVIDKDLWMVNYIGHPYQGGFYYNSLRSQDASVWHSALFCIGHSLLWEYGWEAGMEQPSIQDLISTPVAGILVGELSHIATQKLSKNGFSWYEVILVCLMNPAYAINNGFRVKRLMNP